MAFDFRLSARHERKRDAVEIKSDFITSNAFLLGHWIAQHEHRISFEIGKISRAHENTAKLRLVADEVHHVEFPLLFGEEDLAIIQAIEILAVPFAMVIAFVGRRFFPPGCKVVIHQDI